VVSNISRLMEGAALEQRRARRQSIGLTEETHCAVLRPCFPFHRSAPNRDIETPAQFVVQRHRRRNDHFDFRSLGMKPLETRDKPTHGEGGWSADAQDAAHA
jgi:hypothetical protein